MSPRALSLLLIALVAPFAGSAAQPVSFDRHVRPILTANCYQCHGPDAESRKGDLRLDRETDANAGAQGSARPDFAQ